jgi:serine/threonine protein kinase
MLDGKLAHPLAERLSAFGLGILDPTETVEIEQHVKSCTVCCQTLWSLPDDQLVERLRQAFPKPSSLETMSVSSPLAPQGQQLPLELAEHPRYRIVEMLDQGGMGTVYKAQHRLMERLVALKVIDHGLTSKPDVVERFRREVKAAAQLNHPNIVHAYDAEQAGDSHFLVMEFVEGTTLARLVEQQGPLPAAQACDYVRQAALGLQRAFEHGMVHRDIKPHNLMRTPQGVVKILDFGLARLMSETRPSPLPTKEVIDRGASPTLTQLGMVMGTADYMAPEQATNAHAADCRADNYSLGCTLYFLLTGQQPFPEGTVLDKIMAHGTRKPRPLSDFRRDVPPALVRVLERMTAKDPEQRYQTPAEVAEALRPFTGAQQRRPRRRRYAVAAAALLLTGILTAAATIIIHTDRGEFVLETNDKDIAVQLGEAGVKIQDRASNREYLLTVGKQRLPSGEYEIDVKELPANIELSGSTRFRLKRGDTVRLTAYARPLKQEHADKRERKEDSLLKLDGSKVLKSFGPADKPLSRDDITVDQGSWRIETKEGRTVRLFEIENPGVEECMVIYEARLKTQKVRGKAYLEMWCRFPGQGEFFSKGLDNPMGGTTDWVSAQTPFWLKKGERPDLIKLNVVIEGGGTLWIKDIKLRKTPLPLGLELRDP